MKKILIVEDEPAYVKLMENELAKAGYDVIVARDGKEGLAMAKKEKPDLILLDIRMPVMDGMAMIKMLRKDTMGKKNKVIMLTNLEPDEKILEGAITDHPDYYFIKSDTQLSDLLGKIKAVFAE